MLKTNLEKGVYGDDADLLKRRSAFGSNTYPQKKGRSFWVYFLCSFWNYDLHFLFIIPFPAFFLFDDYVLYFMMLSLLCF